MLCTPSSTSRSARTVGRRDTSTVVTLTGVLERPAPLFLPFLFCAGAFLRVAEGLLATRLLFAMARPHKSCDCRQKFLNVYRLEQHSNTLTLSLFHRFVGGIDGQQNTWDVSVAAARSIKNLESSVALLQRQVAHEQVKIDLLHCVHRLSRGKSGCRLVALLLQDHAVGDQH